MVGSKAIRPILQFSRVFFFFFYKWSHVPCILTSPIIPSPSILQYFPFTVVFFIYSSWVLCSMDCLQLPFIRVEEAVSWTQRFLRRKIWPKNRSLFMTNKFESKCLQKFYVSSKHEKECYMKTTSYLEEPNRHFCQHFMRRTTQQTFSAINLASQQKTTKLFFSSQVRKQFKLLAVPFKSLRCCLRSDKLVNCHVWKFCKDLFLNFRVTWFVNQILLFWMVSAFWFWWDHFLCIY